MLIAQDELKHDIYNFVILPLPNQDMNLSPSVFWSGMLTAQASFPPLD